MQAEPTIRIGPDDAIDLHMHTTASDGRWTTEALIEHLAGNNFKVVAVADHDTMASVPEAIERGKAAGIHVVPAVEVTTWWDIRQVHCLVYGVDLASPSAAPFASLLRRQQDQLVATSERMIELLERHGRRLPSLKEILGDRPLRPHFVFMSMIRDGHGTNLYTAHNIVKGLGEPALVDVPLDETVKAAQDSGGVAIIAHPGRDDGWGFLYEDRLDTMRETVAFDGVEAHYRSYTEKDVRLYRDYAEKHSLLVSTGSDSHWPNYPVNPIPHPARWATGLLARLGIEVEPFEGPAWVPPPAPPEDSPAG